MIDAEHHDYIPVDVGTDIPVPGEFYLRGNFAPYPNEDPLTELTNISGQVPPEIDGTLYRIGPNPAKGPRSRLLYHWFDGDGMIDAFKISGGRVWHHNKFVRTKAYALNAKAGEELFGGLRNFFLSTPQKGWRAIGVNLLTWIQLGAAWLFRRQMPVKRIEDIQSVRTRANTNVFKFGDTLMALEEIGMPVAIDPETLETRGIYNFGGGLTGPTMTPHPVVDPDTGELFTFGYDIVEPYLRYYVFNADGTKKLERTIPADYPSMNHSFSVTKTRTLFYQLPAVFNAVDSMTINPVRWESDKPTKIRVLDRYDATSAPVEISIRPCFFFHTMNAFDEGDEVVIDVALFPRVPLFDVDVNDDTHGWHSGPQSKLVRWRLNVKTGTLVERLIEDSTTEFPHSDDRIACKPYDFGWITCLHGTNDGKGIWNTVLTHQFSTGVSSSHSFAPNGWVSEALFAPKPGGGEAEGWLLTVVWDSVSNLSSLVVLDARAPSKGPVATVKMSRRVPFGFHGAWVPKS
jgi:carotenoid cleavage dioxygenase-like enzyme